MTRMMRRVLALLIAAIAQGRRDTRPGLPEMPAGMEPAIFLFEDRMLVDAQASDSVVTLTVADTGPGLPAPDRELAFERGTTSKPASGPAGRGIGLALVRQTVDLLGGRIEVSEPPGATFTVTLPVAVASEGGGDG